MKLYFSELQQAGRLEPAVSGHLLPVIDVKLGQKLDESEAACWKILGDVPTKIEEPKEDEDSIVDAPVDDTRGSTIDGGDASHGNRVVRVTNGHGMQRFP